MRRGLSVAFLAVACVALAPQDPSGIQRRGTFMGGHMGFMTTGGVSTTVDVFDPVSGTVIGGVGVGTAGQESIIAVPSLNRMFVTHDTANPPERVSVIDTTTMTSPRSIVIPNSAQLRRMSLAPDGRTLFVAGQNTALGEAGVFALDLTVVPEVPSYIGGIASASHAQGVECVPVSAADLRPAKVYFTDSGSGMLASIGLIPATGVGAPVNPPPGMVDLKDMDISPDFSTLIIGGMSVAPDEVFVAVVDTSVPVAAPSPQQVDNNLIGANNEVMDVVFRPETAPMSAYLVVANPNSGNTFVYHVDDVGGTITGPTSTGPPPVVESVAHLVDPLAPVGSQDVLYLGDDPLAGLPFQRMDSSVSPPVPIAPDTSAANGTPLRFAFMPIAAAPPAPTGLTAAAGDMLVDLSWNASAGAVTYNIKRSTTSGGPYTTVGTSGGLNFQDTGLTNGTTYYYVVSGVDGIGMEGADSTQAAATPMGGPPAPTGLVAVAGNMQVDLSWNASSGAVSYNIKRSTTSGGPYTTVGTSATPTFQDTGLTNGTTYYYVVSALDAVPLEGPDSLQASATPMAPPPPRVDRICPKGGPNAAGDTVRVEGADFQAGALVSLEGTPLVTTFVDSNTLTATTQVLPQSVMLDVQVENPDLQVDFLQTHYANFTSTVTPRTVNLTLPDLLTGYRMFSLPLYASVTDLRNAFATGMGPYDPNTYRVFLMINNRYVELPNVPADACDLMGQAFWALTRFGGAVSVTAPDVHENPPGARIRVVPLSPGWNMVSMPFITPGNTFSYDWTIVEVAADGSDVTGTGTVQTGAAAALINPTLFRWTGTQYVAETVMQAREGYFVSNRTNNVIYLVFDSLNVFKPTVPSAPSYAPLPPGTQTPPPPPPAKPSGAPSSSACGGVGLEGVLLLLGWRVFHRLRRRRRLAS